jgi:hypothetical protein
MANDAVRVLLVRSEEARPAIFLVERCDNAHRQRLKETHHYAGRSDRVTTSEVIVMLCRRGPAKGKCAVRP